MPEYKFKPDRLSALAAEVMLLRTLHAYRTARERIKDDSVEATDAAYVTRLVGEELPSFHDLSERYDDLLEELTTERPDTPHAILAYVELVSEILAEEMASRYREEGGIASSESEHRYALDLLVQVRNWVNGLDMKDAVEQQRAFYREHPERRPQVFETAARSMGSSTETDWPDLHRRWVELVDRIALLDAEIDKIGAKRKPARRSELAQLRAERDLANQDLEPLLKGIFALPIDTWEALATVIDIAMDDGDVTPPAELQNWATFNKVLKALRQHAPAIEFTSLRRYYARSVDVEAIIANA